MGDNTSALRGLAKFGGIRGHRWTAAVVFALLFAGVLLYGLTHGEAGFVAANATAFCSSCTVGW